MLGPVSSHTAAETRQVVASLGSQPTVAGHSGDHPPDLEPLRATPARPHQILFRAIWARGIASFTRVLSAMPGRTRGGRGDRFGNDDRVVMLSSCRSAAAGLRVRLAGVVGSCPAGCNTNLPFRCWLTWSRPYGRTLMIVFPLRRS